MKRALDVIAALVGLVVLAPLFAVVALLIKIDSPGPVFFSQERMGKAFRPFWMLKFRTMVKDASRLGGLLTSSRDPRITAVGGVLRKTKIDELPQLINVLRGDMSFVGPLRPEVRPYVDLYRDDYADLLTVRPGITDLASIVHRDEQAMLAKFENPEDEYVRWLLPKKIQLGKEYLRQSSLFFDLSLIVNTFLVLVFRKSPWLQGRFAVGRRSF